MTQRVLEAHHWLAEVRKLCEEQGQGIEEMTTLCFIAAALLQTEQGMSIMNTCVDAERKLGCTHQELATALATMADRLNMVGLGYQEGGKPVPGDPLT